MVDPVVQWDDEASAVQWDDAPKPAVQVDTKPVNAVRTLENDGTYTYAQPSWVDYAATVPTQIIGGIRRGLGGMASGAAQMEGVPFETAQQLRRDIAAPGMAMQESVAPTREAYEAANPVRAAAIGIVPEFLTSFAGPVRTLGETSEMSGGEQAYQTGVSTALSVLPVPFINQAAKMSKPAAAAFSTAMAGIFGEAGAAAQAYGPGGGGTEQFKASQAAVGVGLPLAGLGGYATGGTAPAYRARQAAIAKAAQDSAIAQALPQPGLTQRMIAGVPSPEMMAIGAERAPIPFPAPEPVPVARRRLVDVEPVRPMPEDAGLRPVEVPGEIPEIANRPAQQSPLAPERPGRPFLAESLPERAMPEPPPAKPLPPEPTGTLLDILAPLDLPPAAKQQVQAALEAAGVKLPDQTPVPDSMPAVAKEAAPVVAEVPVKVAAPEPVSEVPRVQEAPARTAEPVSEVRPAVDTGPAPTVEAAPVKAQAAPAPAFRAGDTVNILAPDGKVATKGMRVLSVNEDAGTVQVLNRSTGKPQDLPIARVEPVQKPVGELPATAMDEKPTSFGPQRNRSRSGAVSLGGGKSFGGGPDVVDMAGKAVRAVGGTIAKTARLATRASEEALLNVGRGDLADRAKKVDADAETMINAPAIIEANRRAQTALRETETVRTSLQSKAPASGTGQAYPEIQMVIEGKATSSNPVVNRLSKAIQDINRITADWAKGVEGFGPGTEGGKVLLRQWTNQARRMVSLDRNNPMRKAWVDALAKDNNLSPDAVETILREQQGLIEGPEGVIRRDPLEAHRLLKNVGADFWYNGKRVPILEINPNTYGGRVSQSAAKRIAFAKEFGTKFDPAADLSKDNPLLRPNADSKEVSAVQNYVRAAHGIDIDSSWLAKRRESVDANLPRVAMVRDVIAEGASFVMPVYKNALLTARAISNLTGIPAMAGNVGWGSVGKALADTIKTRGSGKALVEAGHIPDMLHTLGGHGRLEAAKNVANEVLGNIAGGKAADRLTVVIAAHAGLDKVSQMKSGKNATHNSTMLQVMGYSNEMATKLAKGLGSADEYKQVVRDVVHTVTGQTTLKTTQGVAARSKIVRDHIPFISFMNEQMRTLVRQLDLATDAGTSKEIRSAAFQQMANKLLGLAISGAGASLAVELLTTGDTTAGERPVAFAGEAIWRAFGGTWAQQLINAVSSDKPAWESMASLSLPVGAVKDVSKAIYTSAKANSTDPLINLATSKVTAAKHARDYLSWAHGLDTGVQPAATRRAIASFYDFAKSNPDLLSSPIQEGFKTEITPLGAAIRKIPKGRYGQPEAIATALREAAIIGKDEKDIYRALMAKRMLPKFKKDYRDYAWAKLRNEIGPTAFREIMLYDMLLETLASSVK